MTYGTASTSKGWGFVYAESHSMLMCEAWFRGFVDYPEIPEHLQEVLFENKKGFATCYCTQRQFDKSREDGKRFFDENYRRKFEADFRGMMDKFSAFYVEFQKLDLQKLSNQQLFDFLQRYYALLSETNAFFKVSGGRVFPVLEQRVRELLEKHFTGNKLEESYSLLLTPATVDILQREEAALLDLAAKPSLSQQEIEQHAERFALHYYNTYNSEQVYNFIKQRIEGERKTGRNSKEFLSEIHANKNQLEKKQRSILQEANEPELTALSFFLRIQGSLRFEMKNYWAGAEFRFLPLFQELAKRIDISAKELFAVYRIEDVKEALFNGKKLDADEVALRRVCYTFYKFAGKEHFFSGEEAKKAIREIIGEEKISHELKGTPASPGIIQGKARIVSAQGLSELQESMAKFQKGEVLITTMTQPNMIFLMKKAVAIVTDQGGMTSHAAVISRELRIPCVVGTQFATKRFKDGDTVEVDAENGIVRKLKGGD